MVAASNVSSHVACNVNRKYVVCEKHGITAIFVHCGSRNSVARSASYESTFLFGKIFYGVASNVGGYFWTSHHKPLSFFKIQCWRKRYGSNAPKISLIRKKYLVTNCLRSFFSRRAKSQRPKISTEYPVANSWLPNYSAALDRRANCYSTVALSTNGLWVASRQCDTVIQCVRGRIKRPGASLMERKQ